MSFKVIPQKQHYDDQGDDETDNRHGFFVPFSDIPI